MKAVFDTNILIDYLNGQVPAAQELGLYDTRIVSVITYIELLVGAATDVEAEKLRAFLATFEIADVSTSIADESIRLRQRHHLTVPDAIIYATARIAGSNLVTRNTKDFSPDWPDVRMPYRL